MKFNAWSRKRRELGVKHLTSRKEPHENDPGVEYFVGPLPWKFIRRFLFRDEGAVCPEELQSVINQIWRKEVPDDQLLFVHVLKRFRGPWKRVCPNCETEVEYRCEEETPYGCRYGCPKCGHNIPILSIDREARS